MYSFRLFLYVFILVLFASSLFARNSHETNYKQVVKIVKDGAFHCTGVIVARGVVATAGHCLRGGKAFGVKILGKPIKVFERGPWKFGDYTHEDWGFLLGPTGKIKPWPLKAGPPTTPYPTTFVTADPPKGAQQRAIPMVIHTYAFEKSFLTILGKGVVIGGDSGSPILDHEFNVIGIIVATDQHYNLWATPSQYFLKHLP